MDIIKAVAILLTLAGSSHAASAPNIAGPRGSTELPEVVKLAAGSTAAVRCLNVAGTAYESCGGSASATGVSSVFVSSGFVNIISTFTQSNPGYVQFPSAQPISAATLEALLATNRIFHVVSASGTAANPYYVQFPSAQGVTGTFFQTVQPVSFSSGSFSSPLYVLSTGTVVSTGTITAHQGGTWNIGSITTLPSITFASPQAVTQSGAWSMTTTTGSITAFLAAGTNNIGDVDVLTLPALPLGTNNIGTVNGSTVAVGPAFTSAVINDGACVSVSATTTVLASNAARKTYSVCARISNSDTVFIKLGATATTSDFPLEPGQCDNSDATMVYTGVIDAIANSGTQSVCVKSL